MHFALLRRDCQKLSETQSATGAFVNPLFPVLLFKQLTAFLDTSRWESFNSHYAAHA